MPRPRISIAEAYCKRFLMFDPRELMSFTGSDPDTCRELVTLFAEQTLQVHLPAIESAIAANDRAKVFFHAHTLKGSSGFLGAFAVKWLCEKLTFLTGNRHEGAHIATFEDPSAPSKSPAQTGPVPPEAAALLPELRDSAIETIEELSQFVTELERSPVSESLMPEAK
eukprot:m51a1_g10592 hypothetical protein (168) ;mRNA; f:19195-19794